MSDAYWRYADPRQPPQPSLSQQPQHQQQQQYQQQQQPPMSSFVGKRPRTGEYDVPGGRDLSNYYGREDERGGGGGGGGGVRVIRDTDALGSSYDRYLRSVQAPSYGGNGQSARPMGAGMGSMEPGGASMNDRNLGFGGGRSDLSLPPDASSTLFVEGLPSDCTRREVSHIFRPFVGYKEVRLVSKESRRPGGDPLILCFVDFMSPAHAATALDALQGYMFDEHDHDSLQLRLQFARYPGARSGSGHRGKR
ncbi:unnamed protein product [Linum trigynum]|uniref:RRM domain-containing protein n=1 Tax=Linum trigynum TaxID=586398 RepID=A0AAV2D5A5_9ROSI